MSPHTWEGIFADHGSDKGSSPHRSHNSMVKQTNRTSNLVKRQATTACECPTGMWESVDYHYSSGKCQSNPRREIASYHQDGSYLKNKKTHVDVLEKWGRERTVGGNAKWCSHDGKRQGGSSETSKRNSRVTQQSCLRVFTQKKKRKKNGEIRISQRCTHACVHGSQDVQTACTSIADRERKNST